MAYHNSLDRLRHILSELRERCPWDKKQTLDSLQPQTIEEMYELSDQIRRKDWNGIKEELGDILLHILFYSKIAEEENKFTLEDVISSISDKLVHRHPHIYDYTQVSDDNDVKRNWEKIKKEEGKKSILSGVPNSMPAMSKAIVIQRKARNAGFDWDETDQVKEKLREEVEELEQAIQSKDTQQISEEFGDVLFSMINLARFINLDPEASLESCNQKFTRRFQIMEQLADSGKRQFSELKLEEMESMWQQAKKMEQS